MLQKNKRGQNANPVSRLFIKRQYAIFEAVICSVDHLFPVADDEETLRLREAAGAR
jgi:hypothetical protein